MIDAPACYRATVALTVGAIAILVDLYYVSCIAKADLLL